jgi:hypothetical protein
MTSEITLLIPRSNVCCICRNDGDLVSGCDTCTSEGHLECLTEAYLRSDGRCFVCRQPQELFAKQEEQSTGLENIPLWKPIILAISIFIGTKSKCYTNSI